MYINYSDYTAIYGTSMSNTIFDRILYDAERVIDNATTGIDGYRKLREAFPTDQYDLTAVKRCTIELVHALESIENASRVENTGNGVHGAVIASASSGSESISYVTDSDILNAVKSESAKNGYLYGICKKYLSGVKDANGVNLLYGGAYV